MLKKIDIKNFYRTLYSDIANDFFIPLMKEATEYNRAVGFFSSSVLISLSKGIKSIADKNGKIRIIASPKLSQEDLLAIEKGYKDRNLIISAALLTEFERQFTIEEMQGFNLLSELISKNILDIKIAYIGDKKFGMYHEKIGFFKDDFSNCVAFTGSLNETFNSLNNNVESIAVFKSWENPVQTNELNCYFEKLWNGETELSNFHVMSFNQALKSKLIEIVNNSGHFGEGTKPVEPLPPETFPPAIELYDYQEKAIENWFNNDCRGIFDMATGTGKTITALGAISRLQVKNNGKLAIVIICPYQHLVEQWAEEAEFFGLKSIIGHSQSEQKNWLSELENSIFDYNDRVIDSFIFITTNSTFKLNKIQLLLKRLRGETLFVADEAHNIGSKELSAKILDNFKYRLALSATVERNRDDVGTQIIYDYFGKKCIEYPIEKAIEEKKLTPYKYFPIPVYLNGFELDEYINITKEIGKNVVSKDGKTKLNKYAEFLLIKRARIIAGSVNKISALEIEMSKFKDDFNMLVYCGTANLNSDIEDTAEVKQITQVCDLLGNKLNMKIEKYTSEETVSERKEIKDRFKNGNDLQALVAIKCLDEGVNIPSIKRAFILASTTNPKEYIQRRGRVLRLAKNKPYAEIFDFITLPLKMDGQGIDPIIFKYTKSLLLNEIKRIEKFMSISLNPAVSEKLMQELIIYFNLNEMEIKKFNEYSVEE